MNPGLARIREAVGPAGWLDDPEAMGPYLTEMRGRYPGRAAAVVRPADTGGVARVVALCDEHRIGVVPQGGNTGLCGGAAPDDPANQIVLALGRLARVRAVDPLNYTLTAEAGCILADVQAAAREAKRLFPLSLAAEGSCRIGGNLATNAGGTNVLRYGNARELTLGLEVVLASGEVWDGLSALRKDNTGYDLRDLFIGSEGTLGVITAACLKLFPLPRQTETAWVALRDIEAAVELLARAREQSGDAVTSFELISRFALDLVLEHLPGCRDPLDQPHGWYALMELGDARAASGLRETLEGLLAEAMDDGLVADAALAETLAQAQSFWRLREGIPEAQRHEGASIKHDVSVPVTAVPAFVRQAGAAVQAAIPGVRCCTFGHVGDGNLHYNLTQPPDWARGAFLERWEATNRIVHDIAIALGGSFSAEHGIGRLKLGEMGRYKSPQALDLMRRIKTALDPHGIMNPGKVLPPP